MFRKFKFSTVFMACAVMALGTGCGGDDTNNNPPPVEDAGTTPTDTGTPPPTDTGPRDTGVRVDAGAPDVRAGGSCMSDEECGSDPKLACAPFSAAGFCTNFCEPGTTAQEEAQCGGRGSTCLQRSTQQVQGMADALCTRACTPTAQTEARGQCPAGMVCTGFWFNTMAGTPDSPGCYPFCQNDSQCAGLVVGDAGAMRCNPRQGRCVATGVDMTLRADGEPCNPMEIQTTQRPQCRGICFGVSSMDRSQGLCGSFVDIRQTPGCPDTPDLMEPFTRTGDNQGYCLVRNCRTNADCNGPLRCIYRVDQSGMPVMTVPPACLYPTMTQPNGIPADGGTSPGDGGTTPTDGGAPADAGAPMDAGAPADAGAPTDRPASVG